MLGEAPGGAASAWGYDGGGNFLPQPVVERGTTAAALAKAAAGICYVWPTIVLHAGRRRRLLQWRWRRRGKRQLLHRQLCFATSGGGACYYGCAASLPTAGSAATIVVGSCYDWPSPELPRRAAALATTTAGICYHGRWRRHGEQEIATSRGSACYNGGRDLLQTGRRRAARRSTRLSAEAVATIRASTCCKEAGEAGGGCCKRRRPFLQSGRRRAARRPATAVAANGGGRCYNLRGGLLQGCRRGRRRG